MTRRVNVGIVGMGLGGVSIYRTLRSIEHIEIKAVCDRLLNIQGIQMAQQDGVQICALLDDFLKIPLDVIIEATGVPQVQLQIEQAKVKSCVVIEAQGANLMMTIIEEKEKLADIKRLKGELDAILNSVQEAIEVAGINGNIKYVNPSFSRVTSIQASQRIGNNIFNVSPNGALARSLRTHEAVDSQVQIPPEPMSAGIVPLEEMEKQMIRLALKHYGETVEGKKQAAKALKISLATLYNKLKTMS